MIVFASKYVLNVVLFRYERIKESVYTVHVLVLFHVCSSFHNEVLANIGR